MTETTKRTKTTEAKLDWERGCSTGNKLLVALIRVVVSHQVDCLSESTIYVRGCKSNSSRRA
jgi:hypothetical protein